MFHDIYRQDLEESKRVFDSQPNDRPPSPFPYDRGAFEEAAEMLHSQLLESHPDSYGGMIISPLREHATVGFAEVINPADLIPPDVPFEVSVVDVMSTFKQREEAAAELRSHELHSLSYGSLEDRIRLSIDPAEYAEVRQRLREALSGLVSTGQADEAIAELDASPVSGTHASAGPVFVVLEELQIDNHALSAGVTLTASAGGSGVCTSGFAMRRISTGERFTLTAAHCRQIGGTLYRNSVLLPPEEYGSPPGAIVPDEDWLLLEVPAPVAPPIGEVWVSSSWQITIHGPYRSHMTGTSRSKKGITTGYTIGTDTGIFCGYGSSNYTDGPGDSGGPVIYPYGTPRAVGVHNGACGNQSFSLRIYSRIYNVELGNQSTPEYAVVTG